MGLVVSRVGPYAASTSAMVTARAAIRSSIASPVSTADCIVVVDGGLIELRPLMELDKMQKLSWTKFANWRRRSEMARVGATSRIYQSQYRKTLGRSLKSWKASGIFLRAVSTANNER